MKRFGRNKIVYVLAGLMLGSIFNSCGEKTTSQQGGKAAAEAYVPESSVTQTVSSRALPAAPSAAQPPSVFVQMGHTDTGYTANTVARFTLDGRHGVTGSEDGTVKLWETETGREVRTFRCMGRVTDIALSPDGRTMASGDASHGDNIHVWEIETGRKIRSFSIEVINGPPLVFSHDGQRLLAGGKDGLLRLWDIASGALVREYKAELFGEASALVLSPDGKRAIAGYHYHDEKPDQKRNTIGVWDIDTGERILSFDNSSEWATALAVLPGGQQVLSGDWGQSAASAWSLDSGAQVQSFPTGGTSAIAVSAGGRYALLGGYLNFTLVELATGKEIRKIDKGIRDWVQSIEFSPDGKYALVGDQVPQPKLYDLSTGELIRTLGGYAGQTLTARVAKTGPVLMTGHGYSNSLSLWDDQKGVQEKRIKNDPGSLSTSASMSEDGSRVVFGGWNRTAENAYVSVWDTATAKKVFEWNPAQKSSIHPRSPVFTKDNRRLVWALGGEIIISSAQNGSELNRFRIGSADIYRMSLDPSERYLLAYDDLHNTSLVDMTAGQVLKTYKRAKCAFSPDGKKVYALEDNSISTAVLKETDLSTLQEKALFEIGFDAAVQVGDLAFSNTIEKLLAGPDSRSLFFYDSYKRWIYRIDLEKAKIAARFEGHTDKITDIDTTADGAFLCSGSHDGTTRFWDAATGKEVARFISFSDGEWLVTTPEGYFNASANGAKYLNVRIGNRVYSIDEYREAFYRPDLVKVALSGGSLRDYRKLADVKPAPLVAIVDTPGSVAADSVTVKLSVADNGGGIGDIRLYLNGSAVVMDSRAVRVAPSGPEALAKAYVVKLTAGKNILQAVAFNADNTMQSTEATLEVTALFAAPQRPSLSALVIGIDEFKNPKLKLNYTVADAELFASTLAKVSAGIFDKVEIRKLTTPESTTNLNILEGIKSFQALRPEDLFVFYIASHGTVDDGQYFLITSNVGSLRTEKLKTDAISQEMLKESIANIPATKKLIIIDTCNAGALGDALQTAMMTRGMSEDTALKILSRAVGSTILSASTSVQEALEGYQGHGLFTYVLTEGLKGKADVGKTGFVKTTELADYVDNEVPPLAEKVFKRAQYPTISISGQAFPIAKVR